MPPELHPLHYNLYRTMISEAEAVVNLLSPHLPEWLNSTLNWSTVTLQEGSYVDEALRLSQSDLVFEVQWQAAAGQADAGAARDAPKAVLLYVVFEYRSTPDRWLGFRLLQYCTRIWTEVLHADDRPPQLPPIVPVVFYQSERGWQYAPEFAELFADVVQEWPWTPRFQHLTVGHSQTEERRRREMTEPLLLAAEELGKLAQSGRFEHFPTFVRHIMSTQDKEMAWEFGKALARHVPGPQGDMNRYANELIEEGLQTGRQEGQLGTIESFLQAGVEWAVIRDATGIDEETFQALRQRLEESD